MYLERTNAMTGSGLMSYGADVRDMYRIAAIYLKRLAAGEPLVNLGAPVVNTTFQLVVNQAVADELGLTIPTQFKVTVNGSMQLIMPTVI